MGFSVETKTYSAMLYALADELRKASQAHPVLASPLPLEEAAERLDALTVTIRGLELNLADLLAAVKAIEINADECLDFDECTAMLVPIDDYHRLIELADISINICGEPEKQAKTDWIKGCSQ